MDTNEKIFKGICFDKQQLKEKVITIKPIIHQKFVDGIKKKNIKDYSQKFIANNDSKKEPFEKMKYIFNEKD